MCIGPIFNWSRAFILLLSYEQRDQSGPLFLASHCHQFTEETKIHPKFFEQHVYLGKRSAAEESTSKEGGRPLFKRRWCGIQAVIRRHYHLFWWQCLIQVWPSPLFQTNLACLVWMAVFTLTNLFLSAQRNKMIFLTPLSIRGKSFAHIKWRSEMRSVSWNFQFLYFRHHRVR